MEKKKIISVIINILIIIFVLYTMINSAFLLVGFERFSDFDGNVRGAEILKYYTNLSNILGAITALIVLIFIFLKKKENNIIIFLRLTSSVMLSITFFTVVLYLAPFYGWFLFYHYSSYLFAHCLVPIMVVVDFLLFADIDKIDKKMAIFTMIPTLVYATVLSIIVAAVGDQFAPYPFLMVNSQPFWLTVIFFILFGGFAYGFSILYIIIKNKISSRNA